MEVPQNIHTDMCFLGFLIFQFDFSGYFKVKKVVPNVNLSFLVLWSVIQLERKKERKEARKIGSKRGRKEKRKGGVVKLSTRLLAC